MNYRIPFSGRAHIYTENEIRQIISVAQHAIPLTQGKYQKRFENKFCKYIGAKYSFAVNNATSALELSAQLCQFKSGDEVIIPGHTYTASAYPFIKKGAKIVWADIDDKTLVITSNTIKKCITSKTKAIVVVHLYGYGADMQEIMKLAKKHNLIVIEDVAQALGSKIDDKMAGTYGDFGVFSFHSHKNITTLGEGGMLVVKDKKLAEIIPMLRHNGHKDFNFDREYYWLPAMGNVDLPELNGEKILPNNYCLGEVECSLGEMLLNRIDEINSFKRRRAIHFIDELNNFKSIKFNRVDSQRHNYHLLVAKINNGKRDIFIKSMSQRGVQCVVQYYPLYRYDLYKKLGLGKANCPATDDFFDSMVSFPFNHMIGDEDFNWMLNEVKKCLESL
jgi:dTDP-4-amino-4,6-dideoxygalactose transaminase